MIYFPWVPKHLAEEYEFDGEHANSCCICKYHGNCLVEANELGVYYDPPLDCDEKETCEKWYKTFIEPIKKCDSKWDLVKKA
jgi:hypothetical protein